MHCLCILWRNNIPANLKRDVLVERLSKVIETGTPYVMKSIM